MPKVMDPHVFYPGPCLGQLPETLETGERDVGILRLAPMGENVVSLDPRTPVLECAPQFREQSQNTRLCVLGGRLRQMDLTILRVVPLDRKRSLRITELSA